jgi:hypothetical protein
VKSDDDQWLKQWWAPLAVAVVAGFIIFGVTLSPDPAIRIAAAVGGGVVLLGVLATKSAREKIWKPVRRGIESFFGLRLSTPTRREAEAAKFAQLEGQAAKVRQDEVKAFFDRGVEEAMRQASAADGVMRQQHERDLEVAKLAGQHEGREAALAEVAAQRAVPIAEPVWRVEEYGDDSSQGTYALTNSELKAVVTDVVLSAEPELFAFTSSVNWPDTWVFYRFSGQRTRQGQAGVMFTVRWRDENGDWRSGRAWLDRLPRKGIVL